jgi:hypothetical protein
MHEPTGFSGVHTLPKMRQSCGRRTPRSTAPHSQAGWSGDRLIADRKAALGVEIGEFLANAQRAVRQLAEAAPGEGATQLEDLGNELLRLAVAVAGHGTGKLVLDQRPAGIDLRISIRIACITSSGSKPAITTGLRYSAAKNSYGRLPMIVDTCAGPMKPSSRTLPHWRTSGDSRMLAIAAGVSTWQQSTEKFFSPSARACLMTTAVGGVVVSKPMAKKTTCRCGFCCARQPARRRRIDHPDFAAAAQRGPASLSQQRQAAGSRHAQWIAVAAEDDALVHRQADRHVDAPIGSTQTGQPGPWIMRTFAGSRSLTP